MALFGRHRQERTDLDMWERLMKRFAEIESRMTRIETEWKDTKDQVRRSYNRLEKAAERAAQREQRAPMGEGDEPAESPETTRGPRKQELLARLFNGGR